MRKRLHSKGIATPLVSLMLIAAVYCFGCAGDEGSGAVTPSHEITVPNGGFEGGSVAWGVRFNNTTGADGSVLTYDPLTISTDAHSGKSAAMLCVHGPLYSPMYIAVSTNVPGRILVDRSGP